MDIFILFTLLFFLCKVCLCLRPSDVLLVTYNHMDAIRSFACDNPAISNQVENVYKLLYEVNKCSPNYTNIIQYKFSVFYLFLWEWTGDIVT